MAHRGGKKSTGHSRDAQAKKLGVKLYAGQEAKIGSIIIRQRGTKFLPGINVKRGQDDTLYAVQAGKVIFRTRKVLGFDNIKKNKKIVEVVSK